MNFLQNFLNPNENPGVGNTPLSFGSIGNFGAPTASTAPTSLVPNPVTSPTGINVPRSLIREVNSSVLDPAGGNGFLGGLKSTFLKDGGGLNLGAIGDLAGTIGGFGQLFLAADANKTAKDTLAFQKQAFSTNLANQTKSYNTSLRDRANSRAVQNNEDQSTANKYFKKNKL